MSIKAKILWKLGGFTKKSPYEIRDPEVQDHMTFRIRQCLKDNPQDLLFLSI